MNGHNPSITEPGKFYSVFYFISEGKNGIAYILENSPQDKGKMLETEARTTSCLDSSIVMS